MTVLAIGTHVDAYTITKILYDRIHLDIYEVKDQRGELQVLKLYKNQNTTDIHEDGNNVVNSFVWNHMKCLIYATKSGNYDYFSISSNGTPNSERAGTIKKQSSWIVRTPMPFRENKNESDEDEDEDHDEDEDEGDEDEDEDENGYEYESGYDEEADDSDENDEDSVIALSNSEDEKSDVDNKVDNDSIVSILLHEKPVKASSCHINILSPIQRAFHSTHKAIRRTPIPDSTETHNMDIHPSQHEQARNNSGCNFELKMVASSMLKRREAKSLAM